MSLLMSLAVAKLAAMMKESHQGTLGSVMAARDDILRSQEPDLSRMASILDDGYLRILSQMALNTNKELIRELTNAEQSISGERNLTLYLTQNMGHLKKGEEALALCWRKSWGLEEVKRYFDENIQALKRGCRIHRIFVQDGTFSPEQLRIMDDQARAGAPVRVISYARLVRLIPIEELANGFGFLILPNEVVVHRGLGGDAREGWIFKSQLIVNLHRQLFEELSQGADPYRVTLLRRLK